MLYQQHTHGVAEFALKKNLKTAKTNGSHQINIAKRSDRDRTIVVAFVKLSRYNDERSNEFKTNNNTIKYLSKK